MHHRFKERHHDERRQQIRERQLSRMRKARVQPGMANVSRTVQSPIALARALCHYRLPNVLHDHDPLRIDVERSTRSAKRAYSETGRII